MSLYNRQLLSQSVHVKPSTTSSFSVLMTKVCLSVSVHNKEFSTAVFSVFCWDGISNKTWNSSQVRPLNTQENGPFCYRSGKERKTVAIAENETYIMLLNVISFGPLLFPSRPLWMVLNFTPSMSLNACVIRC